MAQTHPPSGSPNMMSPPGSSDPGAQLPQPPGPPGPAIPHALSYQISESALLVIETTLLQQYQTKIQADPVLDRGIRMLHLHRNPTGYPGPDTSEIRLGRCLCSRVLDLPFDIIDLILLATK